MMDTTGRYMIASKMNEERLAEVRRSHLLREVRAGESAYEARANVTREAAHGHSFRDALAAVRRSFSHDQAGRVHGAAAR